METSCTAVAYRCTQEASLQTLAGRSSGGGG